MASVVRPDSSSAANVAGASHGLGEQETPPPSSRGFVRSVARVLAFNGFTMSINGIGAPWIGKAFTLANRAKGAAMTATDVATYARERPGMSAFVLEDGVVYHTYSTYARGLDGLWGGYQWLDRAPRGATRQATGGTATTSTASAEPSYVSCWHNRGRTS